MSRNHHRRQRHPGPPFHQRITHQHGPIVTAIENCKPWLAGSVVLAAMLLIFILTITA